MLLAAETIFLELFIQLHSTFSFRAVRAERGGEGRGAERRPVRSGLEELQLRGYGSGVNGGGADAADR